MCKKTKQNKKNNKKTEHNKQTAETPLTISLQIIRTEETMMNTNTNTITCFKTMLSEGKNVKILSQSNLI